MTELQLKEKLESILNKFEREKTLINDGPVLPAEELMLQYKNIFDRGFTDLMKVLIGAID